MKKSILFIIGLIVGQFSFAQSDYYFHNEGKADTVRGTYDIFDLEMHLYFVNNTEDTTFTWRRVNEDVPSGFLTAVCDINLCWPPEVSSKSFVMPANDSFEMIGHFYPEGNCGVGSFDVQVFSVNDTNNKQVATFITQVWCLGVDDINVSTVSISPNPTDDVVNITSDHATGFEIEVMNLSGEKVIEESSSSNQKSISTSGLSPGVYYIRIYQDGQTYTKKLIRD